MKHKHYLIVIGIILIAITVVISLIAPSIYYLTFPKAAHDPKTGLIKDRKTYLQKIYKSVVGVEVVVNECNTKAPGGCNVCSKCCQSGAADGSNCDSCVAQKCKPPLLASSSAAPDYPIPTLGAPLPLSLCDTIQDKNLDWLWNTAPSSMLDKIPIAQNLSFVWPPPKGSRYRLTAFPYPDTGDSSFQVVKFAKGMSSLLDNTAGQVTFPGWQISIYDPLEPNYNSWQAFLTKGINKTGISTTSVYVEVTHACYAPPNYTYPTCDDGGYWLYGTVGSGVFWKTSGTKENGDEKSGQYLICNNKIDAIFKLWNYAKSFLSLTVMEPIAPMLEARSDNASATANGIVFVLGGSPGVSTILASVEGYNPATDKWTEKAPMGTGRTGLAAVALDDTLYALGGTTSSETTNTVEVFTVGTGKWATGTPMNTARAYFGAAVVAGKIVAAGGFDNSGNALSSAEIFDPADPGKWTTVASMTTTRYEHCIVALGPLVYAIGGCATVFVPQVTLKTVEAYDITTNTWTTVASMTTTRTAMAAAAIAGKIYVIGGYENCFSGTVKSVEMYDPATDKWTVVYSTNTPRVRLAAVALGGSIYISGGEGGEDGDSVVYDTAEVFTVEENKAQTAIYALLDIAKLDPTKAAEMKAEDYIMARLKGSGGGLNLITALRKIIKSFNKGKQIPSLTAWRSMEPSKAKKSWATWIALSITLVVILLVLMGLCIYTIYLAIKDRKVKKWWVSTLIVLGTILGTILIGNLFVIIEWAISENMFMGFGYTTLDMALKKSGLDLESFVFATAGLDKNYNNLSKGKYNAIANGFAQTQMFDFDLSYLTSILGLDSLIMHTQPNKSGSWAVEILDVRNTPAEGKTDLKELIFSLGLCGQPIDAKKPQLMPALSQGPLKLTPGVYFGYQPSAPCNCRDTSVAKQYAHGKGALKKCVYCEDSLSETVC